MTLSVRINDKTKRRLSQYARKQGLSQSEVVRMAIDALLHRAAPTTGTTLYERIKDVVGTVHSGRGDLSQKTGDDLYEILLEKKRQGRL